MCVGGRDGGLLPCHGLPWRATDGSGGFSPVSGPGGRRPARRTWARSGHPSSPQRRQKKPDRPAAGPSRAAIIGHSGSPAFRIPSTNLDMSSSRRSGVRSLRLETRKAGSIWRRRANIFCACSVRPAIALAAADTRSAGRKWAALHAAIRKPLTFPSSSPRSEARRKRSRFLLDLRLSTSKVCARRI